MRRSTHLLKTSGLSQSGHIPKPENNPCAKVPEPPLEAGEDPPWVCRCYAQKVNDPCEMPNRCWGSMPYYEEFGDYGPPECGGSGAGGSNDGGGSNGGGGSDGGNGGGSSGGGSTSNGQQPPAASGTPQQAGMSTSLWIIGGAVAVSGAVLLAGSSD